MKDSPLKCDFPETDLEQQLDTRRFRTYGARLASPPAKRVKGISDSSKDMDHGVAYINERFMDIRTAFSILRRYMLGIVGLFMMAVLVLMWVVDQFYSEALIATAAFFVPVWIGFYLFEVFFPLTLPVRLDRKEGVVYVAHRGTFYRIPWDELEVTFSYNWQYFGSGVMWEKQYYSHLYLKEKYYFCGTAPKKNLQRKRISSYFKEEHLYRKWNFIVRYYDEGVAKEDVKNLSGINYESYKESVNNKSVGILILDYLSVILFMPSIIWWKFAPFKYRWPKEVEAIFGKANYY